MKTHTIIIIFCFASIYAKAVNDSTIFKKNRQFIYNAFYIKNADTLTKEKVYFKNLGIPWEFQKSQNKCVVNYFPTDSILDVLRKPNLKKRKEWEPVKKIKTVNSGFIETPKQIWLHPFRSNQYAYTEIAPFPFIIFDSLKVGGSWDGGVMIILYGWGTFKGKVHSTYKVMRQTNIQLMDTLLTGCWVIKAVGIHNKLGKNYVEYIFHEDFGFLLMKYSFYDGTKIIFKLDKVIDSKL